MTQTYNVRVRMKRDTAENWETNNPVLMNGEIAIVDTEDGTVRMKVGDGATAYSDLDYQDDVLESRILAAQALAAEAWELLQQYMDYIDVGTGSQAVQMQSESGSYSLSIDDNGIHASQNQLDIATFASNKMRAEKIEISKSGTSGIMLRVASDGGLIFMPEGQKGGTVI